MKTIIIYCSKHGTTEKIAEMLSDKIGADDCKIVNLETETINSIGSFERIIIGGSIHAGRIQKKLTQFCASNMEELIKKEMGLFLCCMIEEKKKQNEQFNNAFPYDLIRHAKATGIFGGEYIFFKMSAFEKILIRIVAKTGETVSKIDYDAIDNFVDKILSVG